MAFSPNAETVYADGPFTAPRQPSKAEIRALLKQYENVIDAFISGAGTIFVSKASMDANLNYPQFTMAWVLGDATVANNGIYRKINSTGIGSWQRTGDLPYSFIVATDAGAGTANAIVATSSIPVNTSALVWMNIFEANTASPVTVSFNGGSALTIKTNSGNNVAAGGLVAGMIVLGIVSGSTFRLVSDQTSASLLAQVEAVVAGISVDAFAPAVLAIDKPLATPRILKDKLADLPFADDWGAKADGTDDRTAIQKAIANSKIVYFRAANYTVNGLLTLPRSHSLEGMGRGNSDSNSLIGCTKLIFTGSGDFCLGSDPADVSAPGTDFWSTHAHISRMVLRDTTAAGYLRVLDIKQAVAMTFEDLMIETVSMTAGGFRGYKDQLSDVSWSNTLRRVTIRLPDLSTGFPLDTNWSDSTAHDVQTTGGAGSIDRGIDVRYSSCQIERAKGIGMRVIKEDTTKRTSFHQCNFDGNWDVGLQFETSPGQFSIPHFDCAVIGNTFRTLDPTIGTAGIADVRMINDLAATVCMGPTFIGNTHQAGAVEEYVEGGTGGVGSLKWASGARVGNKRRDFNGQNFDIEDDFLNVDPTGILVPRGMVAARGQRTVYGQTNVSGAFGNDTTGAAFAALGHDGTDAFIAATKTSGNVSQGLAFKVGGVTIFRLTAAGDFIQLLTDVAVGLGTAAARFTNVYSRAFRPGSGSPLWTSGTGAPNGAQVAVVGSLYTQDNGGANTTLWVKESGTGNTGWVAK